MSEETIEEKIISDEKIEEEGMRKLHREQIIELLQDYIKIDAENRIATTKNLLS